MNTDLFVRARQYIKHRLGMPASQAFCDHVWEVSHFDRRTDIETDRKCLKCGLEQYSEMVWRDKHPSTKQDK